MGVFKLMLLVTTVLEDEDTDCKQQPETETTTSDRPFQTGAAGDCEPIETRGFLSQKLHRI